MAVTTIPVRADIADYVFSIELGGVLCRLGFRFNRRWSRWVMSIYNDAGVALVESIALQFDTELNNQFVSDGLPPGRFMLFDNEAKGETYSREDFGVRASLVWSDEV